MLNLLSFVSSTYLDLNGLLNHKQNIEWRYAIALRNYPLVSPISPVRFAGSGLKRLPWAGVGPESTAPRPPALTGLEEACPVEAGPEQIVPSPTALASHEPVRVVDAEPERTAPTSPTLPDLERMRPAPTS